MDKITEAEAAEIIKATGVTGYITAAELAAVMNAQQAAAVAVMRNTLVINLGANPLPEAIARAQALADVQAKNFLLDFTKTDLNRLGETIAQGLREGLHSTEIASRMRDQVGLTAQGAAKVDKLRESLLAQGLDSAAIEAQVAKLEAKLVADRAELIARAEVNRAVSAADLANAIADGQHFKAWLTVGDDRVTDECQANEAAGWIDIEDSFPSGDDHPPRDENPNCLLAGTHVFAPDARAAFVAAYSGVVIELSFSSGARLSVTPNHMLLTPLGWACAKSLRVGDDVVYAAAFDPFSPREPNDNQPPPVIEDIVASLSKSRGVSSRLVPSTPEHLHGDGRFIDGNINVISSEGFLRGNVETYPAEFIREVNFSKTSTDTFSLAVCRNFAAMCIGLRKTSDGIMGMRRESDTFAGRHSRHSELVGVGTGSGLDIRFQQGRSHGSSAHSSLIGYGEFGDAGEIQTTSVCSIRRRISTCHVYDLHTDTSLYSANGIISSNCRCTITTRTALPSEAALRSVENRIERTESAKAEAAAMEDS